MTHKSKTRQYEETLNYGASIEIIEKARDLRKRMTEAEKLLWSYLRGKKLGGFKFRRQHPIWIFIADFYCHEAKLVIELDGGIHHQSDIKEHDMNRTAEMERFEIKVVRFTNEQVFENLDEVIVTVKMGCEKRKHDPIPNPSPPVGGKGAPPHQPVRRHPLRQLAEELEGVFLPPDPNN